MEIHMLINTNQNATKTAKSAAIPAVVPFNETDGRDAVTLGTNIAAMSYDPFALNQSSVEREYPATEIIKPRSRDQYVDLFKRTEKRTAIATLQMCRVVYEAKKSLEECDFSDFCKAIGYNDDSAVIRKFSAIGKVQPRLVQYAEQLPSEWSKIYTITQIPARTFEIYADDGYDFRTLTSKDLNGLLRATRQQKPIQAFLPRELDSRQFVFAKVMFTNVAVDAYDWRAAKKALAEIESRLPIRVQFVTEANAAYEHTKSLRYNEAKKIARDVEFQPSKWDYGTEANQTNWDKLEGQPEA
jgi:hypothetical protein